MRVVLTRVGTHGRETGGPFSTLVQPLDDLGPDFLAAPANWDERAASQIAEVLVRTGGCSIETRLLRTTLSPKTALECWMVLVRLAARRCSVGWAVRCR